MTQAQVLGQGFLLGLGLGVLYDAMRGIRRSCPWRWLWFLLDVTFWIGTAVAVFVHALVFGQWGGAHLPWRGIFAGRRSVPDHGQSHFAPHFCSKFSVDSRDCSIFFDTCRVCGWENKKSFEKSKKGLSKMVEMV